ncbi:MAG: cell division protein FtsK [Oscillatoria sp. SIO1A7]|nr:cell division protein FtsK [Oscillatoria sp. SIO1A7]
MHPMNKSPRSSSANSGANSFSATQIRVAFECPRLFYLGQRFGSMTAFLPPGNTSAIGNPFHQLAKQFVDLIIEEPEFTVLFEPPADGLDLEKIAARMQDLFYDLVFYPYLKSACAEDPAKAPALYKVWQGFRGLVRRYAELIAVNRRYCSAESAIAETFVEREVNIEHWFELPDRSRQLVKGQFDNLVFSYQSNSLCAVEYKTYSPADMSAQLAQVAVYSYILKAKKKRAVDSAVYCVLPEFKEYRYSWEELEKTLHQLIPHKLQQMQSWLRWESPQPNPPPPTAQPELCNICSQKKKCQSFFENSDSPADTAQLVGQGSVSGKDSGKGSGKTSGRNSGNTSGRNSGNTPGKSSGRNSLKTPGKSSDPGGQGDKQPNKKEPNKKNTNKKDTNKKEPNQKEPSIEADAIGYQLVETLKHFKIGADYLGAAVGPAFIRVRIKPHLGVKVASVIKLSQDLQVQLGIADPPLIAPQPGYVSVDLPRSDRQTAFFEDYIPLEKSRSNHLNPALIAIGVDLDGQLVEADLSDPNTCHFLVGGTTGSGKSEFLRSLLLSLLRRHSKEHMQIALVDPKRVTFPEFENIPSLYSAIVKDSENAIQLMTDLVAEMERRYQQFESAGCPNINTYNQNAFRPLPRIVTIFDEYADFMADKETCKELETSIKRLGAMARAAGIHLIIATQRPEAKVVTPVIRSNLPGRVALRTASEADSKIVLGGQETAAAYLLGKGDLLYQVGSQLHRLQSLFAQTIEL